MKSNKKQCFRKLGVTFVQIFSLRHMQVILIENPDIANTMRQIFEMVWKSRNELVTGTTTLKSHG